MPIKYRGQVLTNLYDVLGVVLSPFNEFLWIAIITAFYICYVGPHIFRMFLEKTSEEDGEVVSAGSTVADPEDALTPLPAELSEAQAKSLECLICLDPMNNSVLLPCGHMGCKLCLEEAFLQNPSCPYCRASIPLSVVYDLQSLSNKPANDLIAQAYPALAEQRLAEYFIACDAACGKYKNIDPFFGNGRTELLDIQPKIPFGRCVIDPARGDALVGGWVAIKLVGDANVPRGKLCFYTGDTPVTRICQGRPALASVQVRTNVTDPKGFSWMRGMQVKYNAQEDLWSIGIGFGSGVSFSRFARVTEEEATRMMLERDQQDCE